MGFEVRNESWIGHPPIVLATRPQVPIFRSMDLLLVRHGEPAWAPNQIATNNPNLTDLGREQAKKVAGRLASFERVDELWVSPLLRAAETAEPIAQELRKEPESYDWLREIKNPDDWEGSPVDQVQQALAEMNEKTMDEMWEGFPGGESFREFHNRVVTGLSATLDSHGIHPMDPEHRHLWTLDDPDRRVVIVGHAGTNTVILGHLLGLEPVPWEWERFVQPHTGVARLTMVQISTGWAFSLRESGSVTHLDEAMVTF